jgi:hypothetical protein
VLKTSLVVGTMLLLAIAETVLSQSSVDEAKPYGRICLTTADDPGREELFQTDTPTGAGKRIVVHVDANSKCFALVAAFNRKDSRLANNWMPQFVELPQWEEVPLPKAPAKWLWEKNEGPIEFYVLFFAPDSNEAAEIKKLVDAMGNAGSDRSMLQLQSNKLREMISRSMVEKDRSKYLAKTESSELGGVLRGGSFEWRKYAQSVNFTSDKPGVLIFSGAAAR